MMFRVRQVVRTLGTPISGLATLARALGTPISALALPCRALMRPRVALPLLACLAIIAGVGEWQLRRPMDVAPFLTTSVSPQLLDRDGNMLHAALGPDGQWSFPVPMASISPRLIEATVAAEDQRFWSHSGVDPIAVARAAVANVFRTGSRSGASTLTMQLIKLSVPRTGGRWSVKLREAWLALRLEHHASKEAILNAYLNKAPYGGNLVGVEAASRRYFGKPALELTPGEVSLLAGLPKSPTSLHPIAHAARARTRRDYVLRRMRAEGYLNAPEFTEALAQPLRAAWHEFPASAPHLARRYHEKSRTRGGVQVTLDGTLQREVEALLPQYLKRYDGEITNAAVIVVDAANATILARAGSADFFRAPGGQMDLCDTPRSPGSALKPFTYGLAIERNLLYSSEMLLDDALDLGSYNPENFDGDYHGLVSAKQALGYSLNVPAVMTLERVGVDAMCQWLHGAGFNSLVQPADYYGLGLTLGNCEVTLEELAGAYCALANEGSYRALRIEPGAEETDKKQVLSRGTVLALFDMLEGMLPQELDGGFVRPRGVPSRVCWKTGTSTGQHDAWSIVFNRQFVVAVWVGNSDGRVSQRIVGAYAALPLAGRIFRMLSPASGEDWPAPGADLRETQVCAVSGLPKSPWCNAVKTVRLPAAQFLNRRCSVHGPGQERWPGSPRQWDLAQVEAAPPSFDTLDSLPARVVQLDIKNPVDHAEYILTGELQGDRIQLKASTDDTETLSWYLNGQFLGASHPGQALFLSLESGDQQLSCMAPAGNVDSVRFTVREPTANIEVRASS